MVHCVVMGCSSNNKKTSKTVSCYRWFFRFPRKKNFCQNWVLKCYQQHKFNVQTARICPKHFSEDDYCVKEKLLKLPQNKWKLKNDAMPSLNLIKTENIQTPNQQVRAARVQNRLHNELIRDV